MKERKKKKKKVFIKIKRENKLKKRMAKKTFVGG
jgi:hypothetical protein